MNAEFWLVLREPLETIFLRLPFFIFYDNLSRFDMRDFARFGGHDEAAGTARGVRFDAGRDERRFGNENWRRLFLHIANPSARGSHHHG